VSGEWARFFEDPREARFNPESLWRDLSAVDWLTTAFENNLMMHPAAWLIPRHIVESAGPWDELLSLNDDGEYFARVVRASGRVLFCSGAKSFYRSGVPGSLSSQKTSRAWVSAHRAAVLSTETLLSIDQSLEARHACGSLFKRLAWEIYPDMPALVRDCERRSRELGAWDATIPMGPKLRLASRLFGWRVAKRFLVRRFF
jgi:hypothetical protein